MWIFFSPAANWEIHIIGKNWSEKELGNTSWKWTIKIQGLWNQKVKNSIMSVKDETLWPRAGFAPGLWKQDSSPPAGSTGKDGGCWETWFVHGSPRRYHFFPLDFTLKGNVCISLPYSEVTWALKYNIIRFCTPWREKTYRIQGMASGLGETHHCGSFTNKEKDKRQGLLSTLRLGR